MGRRQGTEAAPGAPGRGAQAVRPSDPILGPSEQCGSHAPQDTGLQLLGQADPSHGTSAADVSEEWRGGERGPQARHSFSLRPGSLRTPVLGALCLLLTQPPPLLRPPPREAQQCPPLLA